METAAARLVKTKARDNPGTTPMVCGLDKTSGVSADLARPGLALRFAVDTGAKGPDFPGEILAFEYYVTAMEWCVDLAGIVERLK